MRRMAGIIEEIQRFQQLPYTLAPIPNVQEHLRQHFDYEEDIDKAAYARCVRVSFLASLFVLPRKPC